MTVEAKKYMLIEKITNLRNEALLNKLERLLDEFAKGNEVLLQVIKPVKDKLDIEQLKIEQNYQGFNKKEVDQLIKEIDLDEPIEDLLSMI